MKRLIIFTDCCALEEKMKENEFNYYDKALDHPTDEEAITFFEKKYSEYCNIIIIPEDATDYHVINNECDEYINVFIVRNGKIENIYSKRFF